MQVKTTRRNPSFVVKFLYEGLSFQTIFPFLMTMDLRNVCGWVASFYYHISRKSNILRKYLKISHN